MFGGWLSAQAYEIGDVVSRSDVLYRCILASTNNQPPNATYWTALVTGGGTPAAGSVTLAMLANLATDKVIGRVTAGTGDPEAVAFEDPVQAIAALTTPTYRLGKLPTYAIASTPNAESLAFRSEMRCFRRRWSIFPHGTTLQGVGIDGQVPGGLTDGSGARGPALTVSTTAAAGQERLIRSTTVGLFRSSQSVAYVVRFTLGSDITSQRFWIGWISQGSDTANADTMTGNGAVCLRYSTVAGDTAWMLCAFDGTTQAAAVSTGVTVTAGNEYVAVVYTDDGGVTWRATVYDYTAATSGSASQTSNVPPTTLAIGPAISFRVITAVVRNYTWFGMDGETKGFI